MSKFNVFSIKNYDRKITCLKSSNSENILGGTKEYMLMSKQKRKNKLKKVVMFIICAFSIFLSTFSIFSTYQLHQTASMIYNHPYTVSNESRAIAVTFAGHEKFSVKYCRGTFMGDR